MPALRDWQLHLKLPEIGTLTLMGIYCCIAVSDHMQWYYIHLVLADFLWMTGHSGGCWTAWKEWVLYTYTIMCTISNRDSGTLQIMHTVYSHMYTYHTLKTYVIVARLNCGAWSNAPQLTSCNYFVGSWPPFIIGLPHDHLHPSCSRPIKCWLLSNSQQVHMCTHIHVCMHTYMHLPTHTAIFAQVHVIDARLNWGAWDPWSNEPQLMSCCWPMTPFYHWPTLHPSHSWQFAYKTFGCWAMANKW